MHFCSSQYLISQEKPAALVEIALYDTSTKALCEFNRIQANGAWNNHFISNNYFIVSTAAEVNHMPLQLAFLWLLVTKQITNIQPFRMPVLIQSAF
jgi:hypothetical protein